MSSCVRNISTKNYQNLMIGFHVTLENVGNVFLRHSVQPLTALADPGEGWGQSDHSPLSVICSSQSVIFVLFVHLHHHHHLA